MQMPIMDSSAPAGVTITHNGRDIVIAPTALSGATITALRRRLLDMRRTESRELLKTRGIPESTRNAIIDKTLDVGVVGFAAVMKSIEIPEILAELVAIATKMTYEESLSLVNSYHPFDGLMLACIQAMGLHEIKNSSPPTTSGGSDGQATQDEQA